MGSAQVKDGSLSALDVLLESLTGAQVADGSLVTADLADGSITELLLANGSVGSGEIQTDAVGPTEIQDDAVDSGEVADNSLNANDIADNAIGTGELGDNAVASANVANNTLTLTDLAGTNVAGSVSVPGGYVANGDCRNIEVGVGGADVGDAVVFSSTGAMQDGVFWYAVRVSAADTVDTVLCNFSGGALTAISSGPVRIITFR